MEIIFLFAWCSLITRKLWNLARQNLWCKMTIWSENNPAYMIFLAYRHVCCIKTSILSNPSILLLWYHLRKWKEQKKKNITQREIIFLFAWCSLIFDLTSDGQDLRTHSFCKDGTDGTDGMNGTDGTDGIDGTDGTDGMDGLDGDLVGLGWDRRLLAPTGTGAPEQKSHHWLSGYWKQGENGTDGLDGALVGQGWDGRTLVGARTGALPWAPEQEGHRWLLRGSTLCEVVAGTNFVGAEYLCQRNKKMHIECKQIQTTNLVQDSIKSMYDTIILWLHTTINRTYNVIIPK